MGIKGDFKEFWDIYRVYWGILGYFGVFMDIFGYI